jgi:ABC-type polysaccharide/polyol phosphate export permease
MQKSTRQNLSIIIQLIKGDFKLRYQGSYLGYVWTLFKPLLLFSVIYTVFTQFLKAPIENYATYLLLGIVIWTFFSEATMVGLNSLISKRDLITKIYFPRQLIVIASTLNSSITLLLNLLIFFIIAGFSNVFPGLCSLLLIPLIILLYIFTTGLTLILAALYIRFQDLQHIWEVLLQIIFWLTPIIYSITIIPEQFQKYVLMNPLARFIEDARVVFIHNQPLSFNNLALLTLISLITLVIGIYYFKSQEAKIAEKI